MRLRAIWVTLVTTASCNATPIPQPPPENLDAGKIVFPETQPTTTQVGFLGEPGAAPPNSVLRITNLDSLDPPVAVSVDAEGAFEATISAEFNDEIRFQVVDGAERLMPIDLLYTGGFESPLRIDCFRVELELDFSLVPLGVEQTRPLTLQNDCAFPAEVLANDFRIGDLAFSFVDPGTNVASGSAESVSLSFTPSTVGEREEVFLISVRIDGVDARYPATLHGVGE